MIKTLAKYRNSGWGKAIWLLWTWVLPAVILVVVVLKFMGDGESLSLLHSVPVAHKLGIVLCVGLLPLNIGIESWKWKFILTRMDEKTIWACTKIILAGKSLNVISPFGVGDGFSRFIGLSEKYRDQIFAALAVDRFSQLLPTLMFGTMAVVYLLNRGLEVPVDVLFLAFLVSTILVLGGVLGLYFYRNGLKKYLFLLSQLNTSSILKLFLMSTGRYVVFVFQFYFVFWALGCDLDIITMLFGIAWIFLIKTLLPDLSVLGDLVKREISATLFFSFFVTDLSVVLLASFLVWLINIVFPAILGLFFVSDLKKSF
ncbi:MAG: lysylphosphatidylglycerol synthase domain-containing protein [Reichenbachiella sp.]|uniref:lysylphosphatidylglycerol synthase domain-containing protein n=1 Tax=Reichenbachiella sp. TaxID=2184521 RepID=UPI0032996B92